MQHAHQTVQLVLRRPYVHIAVVVQFTLQKRRTAFPHSLSFRNYSHLLPARHKQGLSSISENRTSKYVYVRRKTRCKEICRVVCLEVNMHAHTHTHTHSLTDVATLHEYRSWPIVVSGRNQNPTESSSMRGVWCAPILSLSLSFSIRFQFTVLFPP